MSWEWVKWLKNTTWDSLIALQRILLKVIPLNICPTLSSSFPEETSLNVQVLGVEVEDLEIRSVLTSISSVRQKAVEKLDTSTLRASMEKRGWLEPSGQLTSLMACQKSRLPWLMAVSFNISVQRGSIGIHDSLSFSREITWEWMRRIPMFLKTPSVWVHSSYHI